VSLSAMIFLITPLKKGQPREEEGYMWGLGIVTESFQLDSTSSSFRFKASSAIKPAPITGSKRGKMTAA